MKQPIFTGSGVAIVTPMHMDQSIDYEAFERLIDRQLENKTDALIVAGTTGEASTLRDEEQIELIRVAVRRAKGRIPVIAGAGSNSTEHACTLSKAAQQAGADALLHVTPYYNKTSQRGLYEHFKTCAASTDLPVILYNIPSRTGMGIQPETYQRLCGIDTIVATKEASGNFSQIALTASLCGDRLDLYTGNDDQILPILSLGGKGVISVLANLLPGPTHDICQFYFDGKTNESRSLALEYMDLCAALFTDVNPIPVKEALNQMGLSAGPCRPPLYKMEKGTAANLHTALIRHGLCHEEAKEVRAYSRREKKTSK